MNLLFIEDEARFYDWIAESLRTHQCTRAATLEEASEILSSRKFDAVFVDLMMPKYTPEQVVATAKAIADGMPVIVLTGGTMRSDIANMCDGFIFKDSLHPQDVERTIASFVHETRHRMDQESPFLQTAKLFAAYGGLEPQT